MTDQSDTAEEDRAEEEVQEEPEQPKKPRFSGGFTTADVTSFIVTVAGTVVGGILLVMVVAVAVILDRFYLRPIHGKSEHLSQLLESAAAGAGIALFFIGNGIRNIRNKDTDWADYIVMPVVILVFMLSILVVLGAAAGVK